MGRFAICTALALCFAATATAQDLTGPGCKETIAITENLVRVVDVMKQRLDFRACKSGYTEDHQGMCVNITTVPKMVGNEIKARGTKGDTIQGVQFVAPVLSFAAPGVIREWKVFAGRDGDLSMQVWRLEKGTSKTYKLICENEIAVKANKANVATIPTSEQCKVLGGDVVGWYHKSAGVIQYDEKSSEVKQALIYKREGVHPGINGVYQFAPGGSKDTKYRLYSIGASVLYF